MHKTPYRLATARFKGTDRGLRDKRTTVQLDPVQLDERQALQEASNGNCATSNILMSLVQQSVGKNVYAMKPTPSGVKGSSTAT